MGPPLIKIWSKVWLHENYTLKASARDPCETRTIYVRHMLETTETKEERALRLGRLRARRWSQTNKELNTARRKHIQSRTPAANRDRHLRHTYGITLAEFDMMFAAQNYRCASCRGSSPMHKRGWVVDHCHTSERIRAILCHMCNTAIGMARDNPETLRAMADYLERHKNPPEKYLRLHESKKPLDLGLVI